MVAPWDSLLCDPDLRVLCDEAHRIDLELSHELTPCTLITVADFVHAPVQLYQGLQCEARKAQPRGLHVGLLSNRQVESSDRQEQKISAWALPFLTCTIDSRMIMYPNFSYA